VAVQVIHLFEVVDVDQDQSQRQTFFLRFPSKRNDI
jgi:hypothetical protein